MDALIDLKTTKNEYLIQKSFFYRIKIHFTNVLLQKKKFQQKIKKTSKNFDWIKDSIKKQGPKDDVVINVSDVIRFEGMI